MNRRRFLGGLAALSTVGLLSGCAELIEDVLDTCPTDPAESGGISWTPDAGRPVFWGYHELTTADGAPRDMRIYYPTYEGITLNAPILKMCLVRWPVVMFLHGQPPSGVPTPGYHRKWFHLPAVLARCGYVVVVPNHGALLPQDSEAPAMVQAAMADLDWVRNSWSESEWVHKQPAFTAVVGHSYGGLLAARIAAAHPEFGALASLSAPYGELGALQLLSPIAMPSFFMWARGNGGGLPFEELDGPAHLWDQLTMPKYASVFQGEHFDYLRPEDSGSALRGPCSSVGGVAADLVALFIASKVRVPLGHTNVNVNLAVPQVALTPQQQFFAGAHMQGQDAFDAHEGCHLDLKWNVDGVTGNRSLGP